MSNSRQIDSSLEFVRAFFEKEVSSTYVYHSFQHTLDVLDNSLHIGRELALSESDLELIGIAAAFHDSGHSEGHHDHEERSAKNALIFLRNSDISEDQKKIISEAILATKVPQNPHSTIAAVLCDADLMYLASDNFIETAQLLLQEWRLTGRSHISIKKFYEMSIEFLDEHRFHTEYGRLKLEMKKKKNKQMLVLLLKDL